MRLFATYPAGRQIAFDLSDELRGLGPRLPKLRLFDRPQRAVVWRHGQR
jgi:hypothetical protein